MDAQTLKARITAAGLVQHGRFSQSLDVLLLRVVRYRISMDVEPYPSGALSLYLDQATEATVAADCKRMARERGDMHRAFDMVRQAALRSTPLHRWLAAR